MAYKRKYKEGDEITSLDELAKQEFVYFNSKIYHAGWFMSWPFRTVRGLIDAKRLRYAVKTESKEKFGGDE